MVKYLTIIEIQAINRAMIMRYSPGEQIGVKDQGLLESAVFRPQQTFGGEELYPTIEGKSAALLESLAQNHAFQNANKRTAFMALFMFLDYNQYKLQMPHKFAEDFTVNVVNKVYSVEEVQEIIKDHIIYIGI
jgi:death-on-curing protein